MLKVSHKDITGGRETNHSRVDKPGSICGQQGCLCPCVVCSHVVLATTCVKVVGYVEEGRETSPRASTFSSCEFQVPDELWIFMPESHSSDALATVNMKSW